MSKFRLACAISALLVSGGCFAAPRAGDQPGFYLGLAASNDQLNLKSGSTLLVNEFTGNSYNSKIKKQPWGGSYRMGYNFAMQNTPMLLGIEGDLMYLGNVTFSKDTVNTPAVSTPQSIPMGAVSLLATAHYSIKQFDVFAKAGVAYETGASSTEETAANPGNITNVIYDFKGKATPMFGAGIGYSFNNHLRAFSEFDCILGDQMNGQNIGGGQVVQDPDKPKVVSRTFSYQLYSVGLTYTF